MAAGLEGAYSWGSNSHGQLGLSNPRSIEQVLEPTKIPLPEAMIVKVLTAGGRHSGAVTFCGKVCINCYS